MSRHDVGVALDEHQVPVATHVFHDAVVGVDQTALVEPRRLSRVHVLRSRRSAVDLVVDQAPGAEAHGASAIVTDRDHQSTAEEVVGTSVALAHAHQPRLHEQLAGQAFAALGLGLGELDQGLAAAGRVADAEGLDRVGADAAGLQVLAGATSLAALERGAVEGFGPGQNRQASVVLGAGAVAFALGQLDACARGEHLDRVAERHAVLALDELDHVAALGAGAEAVPETGRRIDLERRRALLVHRATGPEQTPFLHEDFDVLTHDVFDLRAGLDVLDGAAEFGVLGQGRSVRRRRSDGLGSGVGSIREVSILARSTRRDSRRGTARHPPEGARSGERREGSGWVN